MTRRPLLIEASYVQRDEPAAVGADGYEPASGRQGVEGARPAARVADVLNTTSAPCACRDPLHLGVEGEPAIVHSSVRAERHGRLDARVGAGGSDHPRPRLFATARGALRQPPAAPMTQRPVPGLELGQMALAEGQREATRDHRRVRKRDLGGHGHAARGGQAQIPA